MTYDASDRRHVRQAEKAAKAVDQANREVLVGIMSTTAGRAWVWNHLARLDVFGTPLAPDAYQTYFLLGKQDAGKMLMADIMRWCPDEFIQAMHEANQSRPPEPEEQEEEDEDE